MSLINNQIVKLLNDAGVNGQIEITSPPNPEMGDFAFPCFGFAKDWKKSPVDCAKDIVVKIERLKDYKIIERVEAVGPYVNFFINPQKLAEIVLNNHQSSIINQQSTIMVEFAHPNTHKPVHIGHLRNMLTGESLVRLLENQGNKVIRANYQGDVGMHIAKCLWGIFQISDFRFQIAKLKTVSEQARFLGEVYAQGGQAYESDTGAKKEIEEINVKIYSKEDKKINEIYKKTRKWSLDYFNEIYKRIGVKKFDRLYFESETFERGRLIVLDGLKKGVFKKGDGGAIIFEGSKYGLHDRVFLNSLGLPVYEAKDQSLAELQFKEYNPDELIHLVAKEQKEYFKVVFKALEYTLPISQGKEKHLVYGWVSLKGGKMSSRTGKVVLAEWLLDEAEKKIAEMMKDRKMKEKKALIRKIANAAVKYSFLKTGIENDIVFDFNESISMTGDSGPYLLYIVARINSIIKRSKDQPSSRPSAPSSGRGAQVEGKIKKSLIPERIESVEKRLLLELARFEEVSREAAEMRDPSKVAKYLFELSQIFNNFYQICPVLKADSQVKSFRLKIINLVKQKMKEGLVLLGIDTVEEM